MSDYGSAYGSHAATSQPVKAVVKWFNALKGFGFVAPTEGGGDAFLHISVLNRAGLQEIAEGTEILCTLAAGQKGQQVTTITQVLGMSANAPAGGNDRGSRGGSRGGYDGYDGGSRGGYEGGGYRDRGGDAGEGSSTEVTGTVKWFKPDKGFGFVSPDDGGKDVFVHKSLLRRCGILILDPGQRVNMRVQDSSKGREADWIAVGE